MGLQVVYFVLSLYGWYEWLYGGKGHTALHVSRTPARSVARARRDRRRRSGRLLGRLTSHFPASRCRTSTPRSTTASLIAQWMMTRKLLENWALWIVLDVVYVGMFIFKGLYLTAANYAVYLALAVMGYVAWKRSLDGAAVA